MDYLTVEQVKKEATTLKKALELSIKHHYQNTQLKPRDLVNRSYYKKTQDRILESDLCGLCIWYGFKKDKGQSCESCIIEPECCDNYSLYARCRDAIIDYDDDKTPANWQAFIDAEKAMHKYLCSLRKKI